MSRIFGEIARWPKGELFALIRRGASDWDGSTPIQGIA